ncbi:MAG: hypothetical protein KIT11_02750 [Fimbriimonadaceae bacterium]|nr:hypothetical protein [Fimbriimonadaceae bacterium]QYK54712.1 MAG: hypothetical protein KF733_06775 [Fimbriimonadaceae bacterium]
MSTDMKMSFSGMMDREMKMKTDTSQNIDFGADADGWSKFTITTTDIKMAGDDPGQGMGGDPQDMVDGLKKVKIVGEVNQRGGTRNVQLADADSLDPMSQGAMVRSVEQFTQLGFFGLEFPEDDVSVGTKWSKEMDMKKLLEASMMGMAQDIQGKLPTTFEVEGFEDVDGQPHAKVKFFSDGKATFNINVGSGDTAGSMSITVLGHSWISLGTGMPTKSVSETALMIDMGMLQIQQEMKSEAKISK